MNLAERYLQETDQTFRDYDGSCMELVNDMMGWVKQPYHHIWIEGAEGQDIKPSYRRRVWKYHAVMIVGGLVHDPWFGDALELDSYLGMVFPDQYLQVDHFLPDGRTITQWWVGCDRISGMGDIKGGGYMIRLTPVEKEILITINSLSAENPRVDYFTTKEVYERRLQVRKARPSKNLERTTQEFLKRLARHVPALVELQEEGWGLLAAGVAVFNTQIKQELRNART